MAPPTSAEPLTIYVLEVNQMNKWKLSKKEAFFIQRLAASVLTVVFCSGLLFLLVFRAELANFLIFASVFGTITAISIFSAFCVRDQVGSAYKWSACSFVIFGVAIFFVIDPLWFKLCGLVANFYIAWCLWNIDILPDDFEERDYCNL